MSENNALLLQFSRLSLSRAHELLLFNEIICRRHRCRKHPQQATLDFGPGIPSRTRGSLDHLKSSLAQTDFAVSRPTERPIIKKLVDNLQIGGGHLEANSSLRTDYPEFHPSRPVIHRLTDQLKTSSADFATTSVSQVNLHFITFFPSITLHNSNSSNNAVITWYRKRFLRAGTIPAV